MMINSLRRIARDAWQDNSGEPSREYVMLLQDFAAWTQERRGLPHCKTALEHISVSAGAAHSTLSDAEGAYLDKALTEVRKTDPSDYGWWLFCRYFIQDYDLDEIAKMRTARIATRQLKAKLRERGKSALEGADGLQKQPQNAEKRLSINNYFVKKYFYQFLQRLAGQIANQN